MNAFNEALLQRLRNVPGIRAAALGNILPAAGYWGDDVFTVKEHPPLNPDEDRPDALTRWADPGYFAALGIPFLSGRTFTREERVARSYKVIVSHRLVQQYFPSGDNPISKHLRVPTHAHDGAPNDIDYEIVGVVDDTVYQVCRSYWLRWESTGCFPTSWPNAPRNYGEASVRNRYQPTPDLVEQFFNRSTGKSQYGEADFKGSWNSPYKCIKIRYLQILLAEGIFARQDYERGSSSVPIHVKLRNAVVVHLNG